jgi:hypothetical protein
MNIGKRVLSLATTLTLGVMIVGLTTQPAAAIDTQAPSQDDVRCHIRGSVVGSTNDHEFFVPGDEVSVTDPSTGIRRTLKCMPDGRWQAVGAIKPRVPGRVPSHTFEQAP